jgi:hypothetical protein
MPFLRNQPTYSISSSSIRERTRCPQLSGSSSRVNLGGVLAGLNPGPDWISEKTTSDKIILETAAKAECSFLQKNVETGSADKVHKWPATVELVRKTCSDTH